MKKFILSILLLCSFEVSATEWVEVDDASKLLWQMRASGVVYFRNLNEFNSSHGGCCYSYKLDTTTPGGKSMWSTILAKIAGHRRITLGFPNIGSSSEVQTLSSIGRHAHASNE